MRKVRIPLALAATAAGAYAAPIDINVGRQLFVDDYLVEKTDGVVRRWNAPVKIDTPFVWPGAGMKSFPTTRSTPEDSAVNLTCATDGGLWWDPVKKRFRLWYQADWCGNICYAESEDGLSWNFPDLGIVPGTNRLFEKDDIDSWNVTPDYAAANPYAAWKLHVSSPGGVTDDRLWSSEDGLHFGQLGLAGRSGDRSTSYYDPFRSVWVFSLRDSRKDVGRARRYFASRTFGGEGCHWQWPKDKDKETFKGCPEPEEWLVATNGVRRALYSFNAVAYESLMLGVMEILYNTPGDNGDCAKVGLPKQTGLHFTFSRDGKTYEPRKKADIAPSCWGSGKWDTGYLSCIGGICVVKDERLWFYYSGLRGDGERIGKKYKRQRNGMYSNGSIGAATLRRDGFAGMVADGRGELLTKPLVFDGGHLFVNAECRFGSLAAEVVGEDGQPVKGFARADCTAFAHGDATKSELVFAGGSLSLLAGKPVRLRFFLHCGTLYSFWVSPSPKGESRGYVAGGGPAYPGLRDMPSAVPKVAMRTFPKDYVKRPDPTIHAPNRRPSTLVSSLAVAPNGRLWATWYCGPTPAEDQNNYVVLATSADDGKTWQEVFVADPDGLGPERPFDPEVWLAPDGSLRWTWADRICRNRIGTKDEKFPDALMMATIPDANMVPDEPPQPRHVAEGVMMCKPTVLSDGTWAFPSSVWRGYPSSRMYVTTDGGKTFTLRGGAKVPDEDAEFDEHMFVEKKNGDIVCYSRAKSGIRESVSTDGGKTWGPSVKSKLPHPNARCFVRKLASGAWLLVKHGGLDVAKRRSHLTAYVSDDEGATWKGGLLLEERHGCSYPDGQQTADGTIYVTYDWDRYRDRTIYFCTFTEEDVRAGKPVSGKVRMRQVISKGTGRPVMDPEPACPPDAKTLCSDHRPASRKWNGPAVTLAAPNGRLWKTWCANSAHNFDSHHTYAVLATSIDGGKTWKEVLVEDPDDFWPRRTEQPRLELEDGRLVWSWTDRVSNNKDGTEETWRIVLDVGNEPPRRCFWPEFVNPAPPTLKTTP